MNMSNDTNIEMIEWISSSNSGGSPETMDNACTDLFNLHIMGEKYKKFHGHIALVVCIFGTVANILNVIVLTRKEMSTPINRMLTALAVADMLVMLEYIPFALHNYVLSRPDEAIYSYSWAVFVLFHSNFSQIFHTISIQLTLTMAVWRYIAIKGSNRSASYCTIQRCNLCILFSYILPIFLCIPLYLTFAINVSEEIVYQPPIDREFLKSVKGAVDVFCSKYAPASCNQTTVLKYHVGMSNLAESHDGLLKSINFWTYSVVFKLFPCAILTFFMCWLVNTLYKARKHHKQMLEGKSTGYQMTTLNNEGHSVAPEAKSMMMTEEGGGGGGGCSLPRRKGSAHRHVKISQAEEKSLLNHNSHQTPNQNHNGGAQHQLNSPSRRPSGSSHLNLNPNSFPSDQIPLTDQNGKVSGAGTGAGTPGSLSPTHLPSNSARGSVDSRGTPDTIPNPNPNSNLNQDQKSAGGGDGHRRSKGFMRFPSIRRSSGDGTAEGKKAKPSKNKRTDRTSKMLIAVLVLFLVTELPQGVMALLSGILGQRFFHNCYNSWAEVWDTLALINGAINFILYCFMSKQFRLQFRLIFRVNRYWKRPKWINITTCNHNATISTTV